MLPHARDVAVNFTSPVSLLRATDFTVTGSSADIVVVNSATLLGRDKSWVLSVAIGASTPACPTGFTARGAATSAAAPVCIRAIDTVGTWTHQAASCAPYRLAEPRSSATATSMAAEAAALLAPYWCVTAGMWGAAWPCDV